MSFFKSFFTKENKKKLDNSLSSTKKSFFSKLSSKIIGNSKVDDDLLDELEMILIQSDVGVNTTLKIIKALESRVSKDNYTGTDQLMKMVRDETIGILSNHQKNDVFDFDKKLTNKPYVIMVVGVNGVGKTTTIGKLANLYKKSGKSVILGASDTFRAAAIDQLKVWAERVDVPIVSQKMGSDPASVAFDTLQSAKSTNKDVVIIDTAGRLHNKINLMNELTKIKSVMNRVIPEAPHEILLVLDGSTGQNAFEQAKQFISATNVNALAITKLDGTAKGGVVIGISDQFNIPIKYIGVGEKIEDLQPFDSESFVTTLFS
jgi:fused signal recognition particle receptor